MEVNLEFELEDGMASFGIELSNAKGERYRVGYNATTRQFFSDRREAGKKDFSKIFAHKIHVAPRLLDGKTVQMRIFFDRSSMELFADGGRTVLTDLYFPNEDFKTAKIFAQNGTAKLLKGQIWALKQIWK